MNTIASEDAAREALREWIVSHARRPLPGGLPDDLPILEQRVITSLQVMELILFVEKTSGRRVDVSQLKPTSFRSVNDIHRTFFAGSRDEQPAV